jgi:hypothetical protein
MSLLGPAQVRLGRWCQMALALALTVALQVGLVTVVLWGALQTATPAAFQNLQVLQSNLSFIADYDGDTSLLLSQMWCGSATSCNVRQAAMEQVKAAIADVPLSWPGKPFDNTGKDLFSGTCSVLFRSNPNSNGSRIIFPKEDVAPLGDPRCYLCSLTQANSSDCNITTLEDGTPRRLSCASPASRLQTQGCLFMLSMDVSLTYLLGSHMLKYYANPDDDRTQADVRQEWPFAALPLNDSKWDAASAWDPLLNGPWLTLAVTELPPFPYFDPFGIAVSLAVVLIAINVHKEVCRAHLLARLALTHSRCMPAFFAPLAILPLTPRGAMTTPLVWRWLGGLCALALPVVQICVAVYVLFSASLVYELASETKDIISVIYNSAALLCVLELDNHVGAMISERLGTFFPLRGRASGPDHLELSQPAPGPPKPAAAVVGYAYNALLGALAIAEVATAVMPLKEVEHIPMFRDMLKTNLNDFRGSMLACLVFGVLYTAAVAVLFDAPLPPATPSSWPACAKLALVAAAAVGAASRYTDYALPTYAYFPNRLTLAFIWAFNGLALASLALFAIWPWRSCHLARRRGAITNSVPADTE